MWLGPFWPADISPTRGEKTRGTFTASIEALRERRVKPLPLVGRGLAICDNPAPEGEMRGRTEEGGGQMLISISGW
jgi:hypothetical protein